MDIPGDNLKLYIDNVEVNKPGFYNQFKPGTTVSKHYFKVMNYVKII